MQENKTEHKVENKVDDLLAYNMELEKVKKEAKKFKVLATYRGILNEEEFTAFTNDENVSEDSIKDYLLEKKVKDNKPVETINPKVNVENTGKNYFNKIIEDAICLIAGVKVKDADRESLRIADSRRIKPIITKLKGIDALSSNSDFMVGMTTSDLPNLLKSAGNRILADKFQQADVTYPAIVNRVAHTDFREYSTVTRSVFNAGIWKDAVEGAEASKVGLQDSITSSRLHSMYSAFSLTRQMLINDDLGALVGLVTEFAESANKLINQRVYEFLEARGYYKTYKYKDGKPLFDKTHNNLLDGANSTLTEVGLSTARAMMLRATDEWGNIIRVYPKYLIVPPELLTTANILIGSSATLQDSKNSGVINEFKGAYTIITDPELNDSKACYLATQKAINLGYLAQTGGNPVIEVTNNNAIEGVSYQGVIDLVLYDNGYQQLLKLKGE